MLLGQAGSLDAFELDGLRWGRLAPGHSSVNRKHYSRAFDKAEAIERIESMANEELNPKPAAPGPAPTPAAAGTPPAASAVTATTPEKIGIEDFTKVEMRVGR